MKAFGMGSREDAYAGSDFAISAIGELTDAGAYINLHVQGIHEKLDQAGEGGYYYPDGVWVSLGTKGVDELITALQYWQKYKTFNKED